MQLFKATLYILILMASNYLFSQSSYHLNYYGEEEGLLSSSVYYTMQDSKGYIWFCTNAGVSRFDGIDFKHYTSKEGLVNGHAFRSFEDEKGRIWFSSWNKELTYFENDSMHTFHGNKAIIDFLGDAKRNTAPPHDFRVINDTVWLGLKNRYFLKILPNDSIIKPVVHLKKSCANS